MEAQWQNSDIVYLYHLNLLLILQTYHLTPLSDLFIQVKCKRTQFVKGQKQYCMVARVGARRECLIRWSDCWTEYLNAISLWKLLWPLGFILNCPSPLLFILKKIKTHLLEQVTNLSMVQFSSNIRNLSSELYFCPFYLRPLHENHTISSCIWPWLEITVSMFQLAPSCPCPYDILILLKFLILYNCIGMQY